MGNKRNFSVLSNAKTGEKSGASTQSVAPSDVEALKQQIKRMRALAIQSLPSKMRKQLEPEHSPKVDEKFKIPALVEKLSFKR